MRGLFGKKEKKEFVVVVVVEGRGAVGDKEAILPCE